MPAIDEFVAKLNVEHFKWLLATEIDEAKRKTLLTLLAEEEAKLKSLVSARARSSATPANASDGPRSAVLFRR